jgi:Domain of unknown function (DUF1857)
MLHHTHTLPINESGQPHINAQQVWSGLMLRVIEQTRFTVGLDAVDILEQSDNRYRRALHFGTHVVHDNVYCVPQESVEFVTDETDAAPSGRLLIRLLQEDELCLSFEYTTQFPEPSDDEERQLLGMVKAAYVAADADMIRIIRELALNVRH